MARPRQFIDPTSALNRLSKKKQVYVKAKASGKTSIEARAKAGYSPGTKIENIETADVKQAFAEIMRNRIKPYKLAQRIDEGLDAMETKFFHKDGVVTDSRNTVAWGERRAYAELAAQFTGYWSPKTEVDVTQKLDQATAERLTAIAEKLIPMSEFSDTLEADTSIEIIDSE